MSTQTQTAIDIMDTEARYTAPGFAGIALYVLGWAQEEVYTEGELACEDDKCDHAMSLLCWYEGEWEVVDSDSQVRVVMVGDDTVHYVDVDDLIRIEEDAYCAGCGQIGCQADGR